MIYAIYLPCIHTFLPTLAWFPASYFRSHRSDIGLDINHEAVDHRVHGTANMTTTKPPNHQLCKPSKNY